MTILRIVVLVAVLSLDFGAALAQQRTTPPPTWSREQFREQFNENALFLMGGPLGQSDIAYAADIAGVVDDGRVLPIVGAAAEQNVKDVLFLRGVDLALTDTATLNALRRSSAAGPGLEKQIAYVSVLYAQEVHILVRSDIAAIGDLRGKKVNLDIIGSGSAMHLPELFKAAGVDVDAVNMPQPDAIEAMRRGELDATACICAKPVAAFQAIAANSGFKLLGVPDSDALEGQLLPALISGDDYPGLVPSGTSVETTATTAVLISFNWPKGSPRYDKTARFVDAFFSKFHDLLKPPRQPGWHAVNLAASLPGWQRFLPAQQWLEARSRTDTSVNAEFAKFAAERGVQNAQASSTENSALFREFLESKSKEPADQE